MQRLATTSPLGKTGLEVPPIIFGTSCLGNLYEALPAETKLGIVKAWFGNMDPPVVADSAGKYGAGMALEVMGNALRQLGRAPETVLISNKLGWLQTPLRTPEPTFERGVWMDLKHDAEQRISYDGILACWRQGCELLGAPYTPQLVSVHDPDEYLAQAKTPADRRRRFQDVCDAYRALHELKQQGLVKAVGVGSKDWTVIREFAAVVPLDWVMLACSLTIFRHPPELLAFVAELHRHQVGMINSAVFHAGFLTGGAFFDYRKPDPADAQDRELFVWREKFTAICKRCDVKPADACVRFGMTPPGVVSISLNTSRPERVRDNVRSVQAEIPAPFWAEMKSAGLIAKDYPYVP